MPGLILQQADRVPAWRQRIESLLRGGLRHTDGICVGLQRVDAKRYKRNGPFNPNGPFQWWRQDLNL
jgi:hypothetical protein